MPNFNFSRLEYLDALIRRKATGDPRTLAQKMNTSVRTVYNYINSLKAQGAPIGYNRHKETYYYQEEGYFCFKFMRDE